MCAPRSCRLEWSWVGYVLGWPLIHHVWCVRTFREAMYDRVEYTSPPGGTMFYCVLVWWSHGCLAPGPVVTLFRGPMVHGCILPFVACLEPYMWLYGWCLLHSCTL